MTAYVGRHRAPKSTTTLTRVTTTAAAGVVAAGMTIPAAATASAAPVTAPAVTAPTVTKAKAFTGLVKVGSRGSVVKAVQRKVGATADGVFGPRTKAAVKRWQKRNRLVADGIVGPRTGTKMGLGSTAAAKKTNRTTKVASRTATRTSTSSILATARSLKGTPYRWGGTTPAGFDCSGFTSYVFRQHGKTLPRTAEQQRRAATRVSTPRVGDLVFFGAPAYHMGIYAGNGKLVDAGSSGGSVRERSIWTSNVSYGRF